MFCFVCCVCWFDLVGGISSVGPCVCCLVVARYCAEFIDRIGDTSCTASLGRSKNILFLCGLVWFVSCVLWFQPNTPSYQPLLLRARCGIGMYRGGRCGGAEGWLRVKRMGHGVYVGSGDDHSAVVVLLLLPSLLGSVLRQRGGQRPGAERCLSKAKNLSGRCPRTLGGRRPASKV